MKPKARKKDGGKPDYQPTSRERAVLEKHALRRAAKTAAPGIKVLNAEKGTNILPDHPDEVIGLILLMESLGSADPHFVDGLLRQLANASSKSGQADEDGLNFMLSVIKGGKPTDQFEAMLAAQMAAIHVAMMTFARRLAHVEEISQQDSAERAFNKLARTFTTQMEALKRYRTGGEQKVTVQHVSVSEGGQAIVGNVTQAARAAAPENAANSPPALAPPRERPMEVIGEPERAPVPSQRGSKAPAQRSAKNARRSSA